jgi:hypothetical protein
MIDFLLAFVIGKKLGESCFGRILFFIIIAIVIIVLIKVFKGG